MIGEDGEREGRGQGKRGPDKKKRKPRERANSCRPPTTCFDTPEGFSAKTIRFLMEVMPTEPIDLNDVDEMERRFQRYIELCAEYDIKPSNQSAYMAIGVDFKDAQDFEAHMRVNPKRSVFMKKVRQFCASFREIAASEGLVRDAIAIFWQKNYDGLKDVQETVVTKNDPLGDVKAIEALKDRYLPPIEPKKIVDASAVDVDESTE